MSLFGLMHGMHGMHGMSGLASETDLAALQSSTQAIVYTAGVAPIAPEAVVTLVPNSAANMVRWAPDIRALLLQTSFMRNLDWSDAQGPDEFSVSWAGAAIWNAKRPVPSTLASQAALVRNYTDQKQDRSAEILSQLGLFGAFFGIIMGLTNARNRMTFELLSVVQFLAGIATMLPKHQFACRRPDEVDTRILPLIQTPGHGSFPSAHAAQAFAMAEVAAALLRESPNHFADLEARVDLLYRQAHRIAVNRTVAGVHFPMDSTAGASLGVQIGRALLELMTGRNALHVAVGFNPNAKPGKDFLYDDFNATFLKSKRLADRDLTPDPLFAWLWQASVAEFAGPPCAEGNG